MAEPRDELAQQLGAAVQLVELLAAEAKGLLFCVVLYVLCLCMYCVVCVDWCRVVCCMFVVLCVVRCVKITPLSLSLRRTGTHENTQTTRINTHTHTQLHTYNPPHLAVLVHQGRPALPQAAHPLRVGGARRGDLALDEQVAVLVGF